MKITIVDWSHLEHSVLSGGETETGGAYAERKENTSGDLIPVSCWDAVQL